MSKNAGEPELDGPDGRIIEDEGVQVESGGEFDIAAAGILGETLLRSLRPGLTMLVDLPHVTFLDVAGTNGLVVFSRHPEQESPVAEGILIGKPQGDTHEGDGKRNEGYPLQ